jgi:Carboxypeptidase regulatory-like domain
VLRSLIIVSITAAIAVAQVAPTASLNGTVTDASGAAVPGARMRLTNIETGFERTTIAQTDGTYSFTQIPVGLYQVEAFAQGFSQYRQSGIRLNVNTAATVDVRLTVGAVGEAVTVTADAVMVNTQSGTLSQVVQEQYIRDLPLNGRNAATLIRMVPGVVTGVGTTTAGYANSGDTINISVKARVGTK